MGLLQGVCADGSVPDLIGTLGKLREIGVCQEDANLPQTPHSQEKFPLASTASSLAIQGKLFVHAKLIKI